MKQQGICERELDCQVSVLYTGNKEDEHSQEVASGTVEGTYWAADPACFIVQCSSSQKLKNCWQRCGSI